MALDKYGNVISQAGVPVKKRKATPVVTDYLAPQTAPLPVANTGVATQAVATTVPPQTTTTPATPGVATQALTTTSTIPSKTDLEKAYEAQLLAGMNQPGVDVAKLQGQALAPVTAGYEQARRNALAGLSARGMGVSGEVTGAESQLLQDYLNQSGTITGNIAMQGATLAEQAKSGAMGRMGEYLGKQAETGIAEKGLGIEEQRVGLEQQRIDQADEQFKQDYILKQKASGQTDTQIQNDMTKFTAQQAQLSEQFGKTFTLEETKEYNDFYTKQRALGQTDEQIANQADQFYAQQKQLEVQFGKTFGLEETKEHNDFVTKQTALGQTQQQIDNDLTKFYAEQTQNESQFGRTFDLETTKEMHDYDIRQKAVGQTQEQIDNDMAKFTAQMTQNEAQFGRTYSLNETIAMNDHDEEMSRQNLTAEQMATSKAQYNTTLQWQKDEYGQSLTWDQTKSANELTFKMTELEQSGRLTEQQMTNTMTMFSDGLKEQVRATNLKDDTERRAQDLQAQYQSGQITLQEFQNETQRMELDVQTAQQNLDKYKFDISAMLQSYGLDQDWAIAQMNAALNTKGTVSEDQAGMENIAAVYPPGKARDDAHRAYIAAHPSAAVYRPDLVTSSAKTTGTDIEIGTVSDYLRGGG